MHAKDFRRATFNLKTGNNARSHNRTGKYFHLGGLHFCGHRGEICGCVRMDCFAQHGGTEQIFLLCLLHFAFCNQQGGFLHFAINYIGGADCCTLTNVSTGNAHHSGAVVLHIESTLSKTVLEIFASLAPLVRNSILVNRLALTCFCMDN